jgi:DHA1 family tetracycline resistance protein-like MFS transporter
MHPYYSLFLFTLIDVWGFSIVLPLFPFLAKNFNMTPVEVGLLQSSNALAQLVATPVIGALSDKYDCNADRLIVFIFLTLWMSY